MKIATYLSIHTCNHQSVTLVRNIPLMRRKNTNIGCNGGDVTVLYIDIAPLQL